MKQIKNIPDFVLDNVDNLVSELVRTGFTIHDISQKTSIASNTLRSLRNGNATPTRNTYNKLAEIFDWQVWQ